MTAPPDPAQALAFTTPEAWAGWLAANHATASEVWVKYFKKATGIPSITWEQAVIEALAWGWIDGIRYTLDNTAFLQRFTPRKARSGWSKKNCDTAERLISEGKMQPTGLVQVMTAKADGRWDAAYHSGVAAEVPQDFLSALAAGPEAAKTAYAALNAANRFAIYYRLNAAKRPETRTKRITDIIKMLARDKRFH